MAALGSRPAREITTREIEDLLRSIATTDVSPRTVNKHRQLICAIFSYGTRASTYALPANPARETDRRAEPDPAVLACYAPEDVEAVARSLAAGRHRDPSRAAVSADEAAARVAEDEQDAEIVRVAAYAGLRRGELVALRWRDVDFAARKLIVRRSLSGDTEVRSTKGRRAREVPLPDQAAAALDRVSRRGEFTSPDDYVFANRFGRRIDPRRSAVAMNARATRPVSSRFASTTSAIRMGRCSSRAGLTSRASRRRWGTPGSRRRSATCTLGRRHAVMLISRRRLPRPTLRGGRPAAAIRRRADPRCTTCCHGGRRFPVAAVVRARPAHVRGSRTRSGQPAAGS